MHIAGLLARCQSVPDIVSVTKTGEQLKGEKLLFFSQFQRFLFIVVGREAHIMTPGKESTFICKHCTLYTVQLYTGGTGFLLRSFIFLMENMLLIKKN